MIKKILFSLAIVIVGTFTFFQPIPDSLAQSPDAVNVYFFWGDGCPHCAKEEPFLKELEEKYPEVKVHDFEVWKSSENRNLLIEVGKALGANVSGVPFTVIGNQYVSGFLNEETTGVQIENMITNCMSCPDVVGNIINPKAPEAESVEQASDEPVATAFPDETSAGPAENTPEELNNDSTTKNTIQAEENTDLSSDLSKKPVAESVTSITAHFFYTEGCPFCTQEKVFLGGLSEEVSNLDVIYYNVARDSQARELYEKAIKEFGVKSSGLPFVAIGQQYFMGWDSDGETEAGILEALKCAKENHCPDKIQRFMYSAVSAPEDTEGQSVVPETLHLPLIGEVQTKNVSLPFLTFIIGALDGFNPCAMWTLLFLISLLLGMKNRRRMWILGGAFIVASALVYFLFLAAWLNLLLFLGFVFWVRLMIGLVAVGGGGYYLKEYFSKEDETCKVTNTEKRQKVFARIRELTHEGHFFIALGGIILLAFAVNLVELICSAGLPAVYTQILSLSELAKWQYYAYLLFYILIFMLDDLIVFFAAMITLRMTGLSTKYARASHLIGGALMVLIGLLLIFRPEWLMFG